MKKNLFIRNEKTHNFDYYRSSSKSTICCARASSVHACLRKMPDGSVTYRFCIDLKKGNKWTTKDSYPLPLIHRTVDVLSGAKFFSTFDVDRAFWHICVKEEDKKKLAFDVERKLWKMPFGSTYSPSTFQCLIDRVLHGLTWRQCLVYTSLMFLSSLPLSKNISVILMQSFRFLRPQAQV